MIFLKRRHVHLSILGLLAVMFWVPVTEAVQIYSNDFEGGVGAEWSSSITDTTPVGSRKFLGQFNNGTVSLSLGGLAAHTGATVSFDLFVIQSWDGNGPTAAGPDAWNLSVVGGSTLLNTTFSNTGSAGNRQAYPDTYPGGDNPSRTGAAESNTLGYALYGDTVYNLSFTFAHTLSAMGLEFSASGLQPAFDESWGLDNVRVSINSIPEPATLALFGAGLAGLGFSRRKKSA